MRSSLVLIESTSDSGESEDQRPSPEVENRHVSGMGSMGREDSVSGAAEQASTVDTGGAGSAQLVMPQASMCSGGSDSDETEHAQDDESGDDDRKGKGVKESKE